jgi:tetratricopeptide (TPR) repeat protein
VHSNADKNHPQKRDLQNEATGTLPVIPTDIQQKLQSLNADVPMKPQQVKDLTTELFAWSEANNRPEVAARLLSRYGAYLYALGFFDLSSDIYRCAMYYITDEDERVLVYTTASKAISDFHNGLRSEAEQTLLHIQQRVEQLPDSTPKQVLLFTIYDYLGEIYREIGKEQKSYKYYDDALKITMALGNKSYASEIISKMTELNFYDSNIEDFVKTGMDMAIESENNQAIYSMLMAEANMSYKKADYGKALMVLENAEKYSVLNMSEDSIPAYWKNKVDFLLLRSRCYSNLNQYARAYETLTNYITENDRKNRSDESLHNEHWTICHDLIAKSENYRANFMATELTHKWRVWEIVVLGIIVIAVIYLSYVVIRRKIRKAKKAMDEKLLLSNIRAEVNELTAQLADKDAETDALLKRNAELLDTLSTMEPQMKSINQRTTYYSILFNSRNELLEKLQTMVREGYGMASTNINAHLKKINTLITLSLNKDKNVEKRLKDVIFEKNDKFFKKLSERCPSLTNKDKRIALCIYVGMSTHEMAQITGQQVKTVSMARFRLRKALDFESDAQMTEWIMQM